MHVDTENFQSVLEQSMTAPVLLVVHSPSRSPESTTYAEDVAAVVEQYEGRFLAALVDLDANPQIGQALQVDAGARCSWCCSTAAPPPSRSPAR